MAPESKNAAPGDAERGLWLYFSRGKKPRLSRAFYRFQPGDILGELKYGSQNKDGFRWDKSIKAFCLLIVHYVIHAENPECKFVDDPRGDVQKPDAAESLNDAFSHRKGWHLQLFKSKQSNIRGRLFRGLNSNGNSAKPQTIIHIEHKLLPPTVVHIFRDGEKLSMETAPEGLWGLLGGLRDQCTDFRSLRGFHPTDFQSDEAKSQSGSPNETISKVLSRPTVNFAGAEKPSATIPSRGGKSLADWFRMLDLPEIKRIVIATDVASDSGNTSNVIRPDEPECLTVIAEKLSRVNTESFLEFFSGSCSELKNFHFGNKKLVKLLFWDNELKTELFKNVKTWLNERSKGSIFSNLNSFVSVCMLFWRQYDGSNFDCPGTFSDNADDDLDGALEAALLSIPENQFVVENARFSEIIWCVFNFSEIPLILTIRAILRVCTRNDFILKKMTAAKSPFEKEQAMQLLKTIKEIENEYFFDVQFTNDWNHFLTLLVKSKLVPRKELQTGRLNPRRSKTAFPQNTGKT